MFKCFRILIVGTAALQFSTIEASALEEIISYGVKIPQHVSGGKLVAFEDFEKKGYPGFGSGAWYRASNWLANFYVYDLQRTNISDQVASNDIKIELENATKDVWKVNPNSPPKMLSQFSIKDNAKLDRFICNSFRYNHPNLGDSNSAVCLGAWNKKFLKIRLSIEFDGDIKASVSKFSNPFISSLWRNKF